MAVPVTGVFIAVTVTRGEEPVWPLCFFTMKRLTPTLLLLLPLTCGMVIGLNGCQSLETGDMVADAAFWQNMQNKLKNIASIKLKGRLSVAYTDTRFSATFRYEGSAADNYSLLLTSSFGTELAYFEVRPDHALLRAESRTITGSNAEEALAQITDMQLPLNELHALILGIAPNNASVFTPQGILYSSTVPGFNIIYRDYQTLGNLALPKEVEVNGTNTHIIITSRSIEELTFKDNTSVK